MAVITIDGRKTEAPESKSVLEAAQDLNIYIPTLCHSEAVAAYGACRLCMVEVKTARGRNRVVASCLYPPEEGLQVTTQSPRLSNIRQMLIELLMARCPDSPELQEMGAKLGVKAARFPQREPSINNKCILCALCQRVCSEVVGVSAISLSNRGVARQLSSPFNEDYSESCIGCGSCAYICPTGAITMTDKGTKRTIQWPHSHMDHKLRQCKVCGQYWAPEKQIAYIAKISGTPTTDYDVCFNCRV